MERCNYLILKHYVGEFKSTNCPEWLHKIALFQYGFEFVFYSVCLDYLIPRRCPFKFIWPSANFTTMQTRHLWSTSEYAIKPLYNTSDYVRCDLHEFLLMTVNDSFALIHYIHIITQLIPIEIHDSPSTVILCISVDGKICWNEVIQPLIFPNDLDFKIIWGKTNKFNEGTDKFWVLHFFVLSYNLDRASIIQVISERAK